MMTWSHGDVMMAWCQVFVVDQADSAPFNRGALLNIGFLEARNLDNFTCFVFHDVDMVPENDLVLYRCRESERVKHALRYMVLCDNVICC